MAGYSGTPLAKKLGIKARHHVALINAPKDFAFSPASLPDEVRLAADLRSAGRFDVIVYFTKNKSELRERFGGIAKKLAVNGGLWIAWPKKASGVGTDLAEADVQRIGLDGGLVDNKICAIDDIWSGLRFVYRLLDRPKQLKPQKFPLP